MDNESRRRLQLAVGFVVFAVAVVVSFFSVVEGDPEPPKQDIFLVIDVSGSMANEAKLSFAQNAAFEFVDVLDLDSTLGHQVGLVAFADTASVAVNLTDNTDQLKQGISGLSANGNTAMWDGLVTAQGLLEQGRPNSGKTIVLLSDGVSNTGFSPPILSAGDLFDDVRIFSVGYGYDADVSTLRLVASVTDGEYFSAPTGQDLADAFGVIAESIISPVSHYSSRAMMLIAIPILLFIPAIEVGLTTMMGRADAPVQRNVSKKPCPHCQHANRAAAKFCLKCGKPIQTQRIDTPVQRNVSKKPCPHCQHANRAAAKFCLKCGKPIQEKKP